METFIRNNRPIIRQELYKLSVNATDKDYIISNIILNDGISLFEIQSAIESMVNRKGKYIVAIRLSSDKNMRIIIKKLS